MTRILNVVTNVGHYDDPAHPTGLWLSELTHAWRIFEELSESHPLMTAPPAAPPRKP